MNAPFRKYELYQPHEDESIRALVAQGKTCRQIAKELAPAFGRTEGAVTLRAFHMINPHKPKPPLALPTVVILKHDLPAYYTAGWRVASFEGDAVTMEWRYAREPKAVMP